MKVIDKCPMTGRNTFGIEVFADTLIEFESEEELREALLIAKAPVLTIGGGSNLLFMNDFHGTLLHSVIKGIEIVDNKEEYVLIQVGSGVVWDDFVAFCTERELWGAENLTAIPGEVGASAVQNIGAYGAEAKDIITEVRTVSVADGSTRVFTNDECEYGYRESVFKNELKGKYIVTYVTYKLSRKPLPNIGYGSLKESVEHLGNVTLPNIRIAVMQTRRSKLPDPKVLGNAGSFFMNPVISEELFQTIARKYPDIPSYPAGDGMRKVPAGWLIERCGWKGRALGKAAVHDRQALVLVNLGGATGADVKALADAVTGSVYDEFNIRLRTEVNYIK